MWCRRAVDGPQPQRPKLGETKDAFDRWGRGTSSSRSQPKGDSHDQRVSGSTEELLVQVDTKAVVVFQVRREGREVALVNANLRAPSPLHDDRS